MSTHVVNTEPNNGKTKLRFWKKDESTRTYRRKSSATTNSDVLKSDAHKARGSRHGLTTTFSRLSLNGFTLKSWKPNEGVNESLTRQEPFAPLPIELQVQIVCHLSFVDILSLRRTSKYFNQLITTHEATIVRNQLKSKIPPHIVKLYPPSGPHQWTLHFLGGLAHRQMVCTQLAGLIADHIARELFRLKSARCRKKFAPQQRRIQKKMTPLLFTLFHHFETFREAYVRHLVNHDMPMRPTDWEQETLKVYSSQDLLRAYMMYSFLCHSFGRRLRPPSYAGRLEQLLRGWTRDQPSDDSLAKLIVVGGLREVVRIWSIKNYNERLKKLESWVMGLYSRKNGMTAEAAEAARVAYFSGSTRSRSLLTIFEWYHEGKHLTIPPRNEMPMPFLRRVELDYLLCHLPSLWQIWYPAAEHELIERRVVRIAEEIPDARLFINELMRTDDQPVELEVGLEVDLDLDRGDVDVDGNDDWAGLDPMMWRIWMPPKRYEWP